MNNVILRASLPVVLPLITLFSIVILLKGHNEPGGGFIGGLLASVAWAVYAIGTGKKSFFMNLTSLMAIGFLISLTSATYSVFMDVPFMTGHWGGPAFYFPTIGQVKLSSVFFFDLGVYIVVLAGAIRILRSFME